MLRDDVMDVLEKIPAVDLAKTVLVLRFGAGITLDAVCRKETDYIVVRGREAGTNDEGRVFFVAYEEVLYIKLDRVMKLTEVRRMYGEKVTEDEDRDPFAQEKPADPKVIEAAKASKPIEAAANDPAAIAKQNLLARIRAARTSAGTSAAS